MLNFSWSDLWWPWIWPIGSNTHLNSLWFILKINKWIFIGMIFRKLVVSVKIIKIVFRVRYLRFRRKILKLIPPFNLMISTWKWPFWSSKFDPKFTLYMDLKWTYRNLKYFRKCSSKIRMRSSFVHLRAPLCLHFIYTEVEIKKNGRFYTVPS